MSENESYSEQVVETIMEETLNEKEQELEWNRWIALTSVILTVISAICSLGAGVSSQEASRLRDERTFATASLSGKRSVVHVLQSQENLLAALKLPENPHIKEVIEAMKAETLGMEDAAKVAASVAEIELHTHHLFEFASTLLGVAIGLCGLSIILRRKWVWSFGMVVGGAGTILVMIAYGYRISHF